MNYIKALLFSLAIIITLVTASLLFLLFYQVFKTMNIPKPKAFSRTIIFTETGCKIFENDKSKKNPVKLIDLFPDDTLKTIKKNNYEISMAIDRFDNVNASAVKLLNQKNIKVWIWPLHDINDGYWLSNDNAEKITTLYKKTKDWIINNKLNIQGIMLDMETSYQDAQTMKNIGIQKGTTGIISYLLKRNDKGLYNRAVSEYSRIINQIKKDGYETSTFNYPYVLDDKFVGETSIQQMFHVCYVKSDIPVYMLYRSFFKDSGLGTAGANVISYAGFLKGASIGIGSYMEDYLDYNDFSEDMAISSRYSRIVHIYNLESLIQRGWLDKLSKIDFNKPVKITFKDSFSITGYRLFFWILSLITDFNKFIYLSIFLVLWLSLAVYIYFKISYPRPPI